jgi:hypothetical protein
MALAVASLTSPDIHLLHGGLGFVFERQANAEKATMHLVISVLCSSIPTSGKLDFKLV